MISNFKKHLHIKLIQRFSHINRVTLSATYLKGEGMEIGAMDLPLPVKSNVKVKYFDRCSK